MRPIRGAGYEPPAYQEGSQVSWVSIMADTLIIAPLNCNRRLQMSPFIAHRLLLEQPHPNGHMFNVNTVKTFRYLDFSDSKMAHKVRET